MAFTQDKWIIHYFPIHTGAHRLAAIQEHIHLRRNMVPGGGKCSVGLACVVDGCVGDMAGEARGQYQAGAIDAVEHTCARCHRRRLSHEAQEEAVEVHTTNSARSTPSQRQKHMACHVSPSQGGCALILAWVRECEQYSANVLAL